MGLEHNGRNVGMYALPNLLKIQLVLYVITNNYLNIIRVSFHKTIPGDF